LPFRLSISLENSSTVFPLPLPGFTLSSGRIMGETISKILLSLGVATLGSRSSHLVPSFPQDPSSFLDVSLPPSSEALDEAERQASQRVSPSRAALSPARPNVSYAPLFLHFHTFPRGLKREILRDGSPFSVPFAELRLFLLFCLWLVFLFLYGFFDIAPAGMRRISHPQLRFSPLSVRQHAPLPVTSPKSFL